jgi:RimJ/RimL family protein N-acetyltransferase
MIELVPLSNSVESAKMIFDWENQLRTDPEFNQNSYDNKLLEWQPHLNWFGQLIHEDSFFITVEKQPCGFIKYKKTREGFLIGILIVKGNHGKGIGTKAIKAYSQYLRKKYPKERILAEVFPHNTASLRAFENASYRVIKQTEKVTTFEFSE